MSNNSKKKRNKKYNPAKHQMPKRTPEQEFQMPKKALEYMNSLPEEEKKNWKPSGLLEIAAKAGVRDRIGSLLTVYYHIHAVEAFITGEINNWLDGFNLWIKGIRPAMNDVERADDKFFEAMRGIVDPNKGQTQKDFMHDVDNLHEKVMHWEGIPKHWKIGDPLRRKPISERELEDGTIVVDSGHEEMLVSTVTLPAEIKDSKTAYCVSRLNQDETADIVKSGIKTQAAASTQATILAKKDPGHMYVIYEQTIQTQEVATLRPIKAAQRPQQGGDVVKIEISEEEGGQK